MGLIVGKYVSRSITKMYKKAEESLNYTVNLLDKEGIDLSLDIISDTKITQETTKVLGKTSSNVSETIMKRFYLLDNESKIRVLKEVKKTIIDENNQEVVTTTLYNEADFNPDKVEIKKYLVLKK